MIPGDSYVTDGRNFGTQYWPDTSGGYPNPVYAVRFMDGGEETVGLVPPGETLSAGGILFAFGQPAEYSVLRVKTDPAAALALLYGSFALLTAGLWLPVWIILAIANS